MAKQHAVVRFIRERLDRHTPNSPRRLYYPVIQEKFGISYDQVAKIIESDDTTHDYFVDTNWFTSHEVPACVWDALSKKRVTLTGGVWTELAPWRQRPFYNQQMPGVLENAKRIGSDAFLFDSDVQWGVPCGVFRTYYVNLLVERKRKAAAMVADFVQEHGREPTGKEKNRLFQKGFTERDLHIFRKGCEEISAQANMFTDEELAATAATASFGAGANVTILTRDHDVLEQFYKLTGLLTEHYQATLFAKRFHTDPTSFETLPMPNTPETRTYFDVDRSILVKKPVDPDDFVAWLLPEQYKPVRFRCVLFTGAPPNMTVTPLTYVGEDSILELVKAKGRSWGLNTDLLEGRNCHVTGFPKGIHDPRKWVIVSTDNTMPTPDERFHYSLLDLAHAVYHFEILTSASPQRIL